MADFHERLVIFFVSSTATSYQTIRKQTLDKIGNITVQNTAQIPDFGFGRAGYFYGSSRDELDALTINCGSSRRAYPMNSREFDPL